MDPPGSSRTTDDERPTTRFATGATLGLTCFSGRLSLAQHPGCSPPPAFQLCPREEFLSQSLSCHIASRSRHCQDEGSNLPGRRRRTNHVNANKKEFLPA